MAECMSYIWTIIKILLIAIVGVGVLLYTFVRWLVSDVHENEEEEFEEDDEAI